MLSVAVPSLGQAPPATSDNQTVIGARGVNGAVVSFYVNGQPVATGNWIPWMDISGFVSPGVNQLTVDWGFGGPGFVDIGFARLMGRYVQTPYTLDDQYAFNGSVISQYRFLIPDYAPSNVMNDFSAWTGYWPAWFGVRPVFNFNDGVRQIKTPRFTTPGAQGSGSLQRFVMPFFGVRPIVGAGASARSARPSVRR